MTKTLWLSLLLLTGGCFAVQGVINGSLGKYAGPVQAAMISFGVGTLTLALASASLGSMGLHVIGRVPWYLLIGGVLGAAVVASMAKTVPLLGSLASLTAMITGQLITGLVLDHFGIMGIPVVRVTWPRMLGVALLIAGFRLITWK